MDKDQEIISLKAQLKAAQEYIQQLQRQNADLGVQMANILKLSKESRENKKSFHAY